MRFYALRLREAGRIKASPQAIIAQSTDVRFINELKKELKAEGEPVETAPPCCRRIQNDGSESTQESSKPSLHHERAAHDICSPPTARS